MSYINFEGGKFFFHDAEDKKILLADVVTPIENRSKVHSHQFTLNGAGVNYPLFEEIRKHIDRIFNGSPDSMIDLIIFLRITAELLRKMQVQNVLRIGEWSELNSSLAKFLPQFNAENFLYVQAKSKPLEKFDHTKFIFVEGEEFFLPEKKFSTIILTRPMLAEEIFLAAKDFGKIFFAATKNSCPDILKSSVQIFEFEHSFALFELTVTPELKNLFKLGTIEGQLTQKKFSISDTVKKFPALVDNFDTLTVEEKISELDKYIAELSAAEKVLNEIFINLHSDTVKQNFNMLKEFLIDFRLFRSGGERAVEQHKILLEDMKSDF